MPADLLIKNAKLIDPVRSDEPVVDILIRGGKIEAIETPIDVPDVQRYEAKGKYVSPGWMDMHVHLREPGYEHKETIVTGCAAAASGGFTAVACMPNTDPPIHTRDVVEYIIDEAQGSGVDVHPIACVSKERKGESLSEMGELEDAGAVAFSDDGSPVQDGGLMRRAMEYASMLDRAIINHMEELTLNPHGHMHEGRVATRLGVAGIPSLAEEVMIARDILISEYTGGRLHVAHISTARGVELVREAKARGVAVTAEVCTHHITLTDQAVEETGYSTNTKMHPPLRPPEDVEALKEGLADGTIDAICTDHAPHASFEKEVEFIEAPFGIIGLETAWGIIGRELVNPGVLKLRQVLDKLIVQPRRILRLNVPALAKDQPANLTIFDTDTHWIFSERHIRSKSRNTPFVGEMMMGKVWATYNQGRLVEAPEP